MSTIVVKDGIGNNISVPITPIGQTSSANSVSVVLASDQPALSVLPNASPTSIATNQVNVNTSITLIANTRTGSSGTGRVTITVFNFGYDFVFLGNSGINANTGVPLGPGDKLTITTTSAIYGIANSPSQLVAVLETY